MKAIIALLYVLVSAQVALANPSSNLTCTNEWITIEANLSSDFKITNASYHENEDQDNGPTAFEYGKPEGRTIGKGPEKGKIEFALGLFGSCELFLRLSPKGSIEHSTLRQSCPDGGQNEYISCELH